jgi:hypothetical protein
VTKAARNLLFQLRDSGRRRAVGIMMRLARSIGVVLLALTSGAQAQTAPAPPAPSAKSPGGTVLLYDEVNKLQRRIVSCWSPPASPGAGRAAIIVRMKFDKNGKMIGEPSVSSDPSDQRFATMMMAVKDAVKRCQPFPLPPGKYDAWRQLELRFDSETLPSASLRPKSHK